MSQQMKSRQYIARNASTLATIITDYALEAYENMQKSAPSLSITSIDEDYIHADSEAQQPASNLQPNPLPTAKSIQYWLAQENGETALQGLAQEFSPVDDNMAYDFEVQIGREYRDIKPPTPVIDFDTYERHRIALGNRHALPAAHRPASMKELTRQQALLDSQP